MNLVHKEMFWYSLHLTDFGEKWIKMVIVQILKLMSLLSQCFYSYLDIW